MYAESPDETRAARSVPAVAAPTVQAPAAAVPLKSQLLPTSPSASDVPKQHVLSSQMSQWLRVSQERHSKGQQSALAGHIEEAERFLNEAMQQVIHFKKTEVEDERARRAFREQEIIIQQTACLVKRKKNERIHRMIVDEQQRQNK